MIYLIYFQPFRVGTSSRLANMRNQPKDSNVQAEGRIFKARIKQLPAVPKIMLKAAMQDPNVQAGGKSRSVRSNIGRSTRAAMHMREKRYICNIEQILAPNKKERICISVFCSSATITRIILKCVRK